MGAGIATGYGAGRPGVRIPEEARGFFSGVPPSLLLKEHWGSYPRVQWPKREIEHLPLSSTEVKKIRGDVPLLPLYAFVECTGTTLTTLPSYNVCSQR